MINPAAPDVLPLAGTLGLLSAMVFTAAASAQVISLDPELLRQEEAFAVSGELGEDRLSVSVAIAPEYYLYRDRTSVQVISGDAEIGELALPAGEIINDEFFGEVETYRGDISFVAPIKRGASRSDVLIEVVTQGCADYGVCYPPYQARLAFPGSGGPGELQGPVDLAPVTALRPFDNTWQLRELLAGNSVWAIAVAFFVAGLLLAFTPCVLPMVPIVLAITTRGSEPGLRATGLSLVYVAGMALVYTVLGVLTARSGAQLAAGLQSGWVLVPLAILFAFFGAVILLGYQFRLLPAPLAARLERMRGEPGTYKGAFTAGAVSAVVVSPCVAAPLAAALLFIATTGDELTGALALLSLALGMGMLPLACAAGAGSWLPRSGPLSDAVRRLFGFAMLALAVWILGALVPPQAKMLGYAVIAMLAARSLFLAARESEKTPRLVAGALSFSFFALGGIFAVGGATGGDNEFAPLTHLGKSEGLVFETIVKSEADYHEFHEQRHAPGTLEYYTADWCVSCREIDALVFSDQRIIAKLKGYRLLEVDVTANDEDAKRLLGMQNLYGPPALILRNDERRRLMNIIGAVSADELLSAIERSGG